MAKFVNLSSARLVSLAIDSQRVIVIFPDGTRTAPIPLMFRELQRALGNRVAALDFLIALGTHQPMPEDAINAHLGITREERAGKYAHSQIVNHRWDDPEYFHDAGPEFGRGDG